MRDGAGRRAVKRVARWAFMVDLSIDHAVRGWRGERPYHLGGTCGRCARCCEAPAIRVGRAVWHLPTLRRLFLWWERHVNGFELVEAQAEARTFVFRCRHFDRENRTCDSYESRPAICREYPRLQLWQANPEFLSGCGYRAVAPNAGSLKVLLDAQALTADQRARLRRGLHLEE